MFVVFAVKKEKYFDPVSTELKIEHVTVEISTKKNLNRTQYFIS